MSLTVAEMEVISNELYEKYNAVFQSAGNKLGLAIRKSLLDANIDEGNIFYSPEYRFLRDQLIRDFETSITIGTDYSTLTGEK